MTDPPPAASEDRDPPGEPADNPDLYKRRRVAHVAAAVILVGLVAVLTVEAIATARDDRMPPSASQVAQRFVDALSHGHYRQAWALTAPDGRGGRTRRQWIAAMEAAPGAPGTVADNTSYTVDGVSFDGAYVRILLGAGSADQPSLAVDLESDQGLWVVHDTEPPAQPPA